MRRWQAGEAVLEQPLQVHEQLRNCCLMEAQRHQDTSRVTACRPKLRLAGHTVQWQCLQMQLGRLKLTADRMAALVGVIAGDAVPELTALQVEWRQRSLRLRGPRGPAASLVALPKAARPQGQGSPWGKAGGLGSPAGLHQGVRHPVRAAGGHGLEEGPAVGQLGTHPKQHEVLRRWQLPTAEAAGGQSCCVGSCGMECASRVVEQSRALPRAPSHWQSGTGSGMPSPMLGEPRHHCHGLPFRVQQVHQHPGRAHLQGRVAEEPQCGSLGPMLEPPPQRSWLAVRVDAKPQHGGRGSSCRSLRSRSAWQRQGRRGGEGEGQGGTHPPAAAAAVVRPAGGGCRRAAAHCGVAGGSPGRPSSAQRRHGGEEPQAEGPREA